MHPLLSLCQLGAEIEACKTRHFAIFILIWFLLMLQVYANDLNPRSYHYLKENIKLNKVFS